MLPGIPSSSTQISWTRKLGGCGVTPGWGTSTSVLLRTPSTSRQALESRRTGSSWNLDRPWSCPRQSWVWVEIHLFSFLLWVAFIVSYLFRLHCHLLEWSPLTLGWCIMPPSNWPSARRRAWKPSWRSTREMSRPCIRFENKERSVDYVVLNEYYAIFTLWKIVKLKWHEKEYFQRMSPAICCKIS